MPTDENPVTATDHGFSMTEALVAIVIIITLAACATVIVSQARGGIRLIRDTARDQIMLIRFHLHLLEAMGRIDQPLALLSPIHDEDRNQISVPFLDGDRERRVTLRHNENHVILATGSDQQTYPGIRVQKHAIRVGPPAYMEVALVTRAGRTITLYAPLGGSPALPTLP